MKPPAPGPVRELSRDRGRERGGDARVDGVAALLRARARPPARSADGPRRRRPSCAESLAVRAAGDAAELARGTTGVSNGSPFARDAGGRERRGAAAPPRPVAITVIQIWPVSRSSIVAPKMMFVSSVAAARTTSAASFTS